MGRNNKRNMKLHLKKPLNNKSNRNYLTKVTKDHGLISDCNSVNSENLENVNIDPALLIHIKKIRNIDERMLIWNVNDVIDVQANENLQNSLNVDMVIRSMKSSPFAGYLHKQIEQLNRVSKPSLSGVVMIPFDINPVNDNIFPNSVNNINDIKDDELKTDICTMSNKEMLTISTENNECDASISTISTNRTDQMHMSPSGLVRTSGRAAKKNYLDMIQQPFVSFRKSLGNSCEKLKAQDNSESVDLKKTRNTRKAKNVKEDEDSVSKEKNTLSNTKKDGLKKESRKNKTNPDKSFACNDKGDREDPSNENEETQGAVFDITMISNEGPVIPSIDDQKTKEEVPVEITETKQDEVNGVEPANKVCKKNANQKEDKPEASETIIRTSVKCLTCECTVEIGSTFSNMCLTCAPLAQTIMTHVRNELDLVCVADPPCWSRGMLIDECEVCIMQRYISQGIEWNEHHWSFMGLTTERLRSPEMVLRAKEAMRVEGQSLLTSWTVVTTSCVISDEEDLLSTPCQWDITAFQETEAREHCCDVCKQLTSSTDSLYLVLPSNQYAVCHNCLLRAFAAKSRLSEPCTNTVSCDHCFMMNCQSLFSLDSIRHRYRKLDNRDICRLCLRDDSSLIIKLKSNIPLCKVCIWRIKVHAFSISEEPCLGCCTPDQCASCLTDIASHVLSVPQIITHYASQILSHMVPKPQRLSLSPCEATLPLDTEEVPSPLPDTKPFHRRKRSNKRARFDTIVKPPLKKPARSTINLTEKSIKNDIKLNSRDLITETRQRRIVKPTQFNDFFVGDKSMSQVFGKRRDANAFYVRRTSETAKKNNNNNDEDDKSEEKEKIENESSEDHRFNEDDHEVLDLGDHKIVDEHEVVSKKAMIPKESKLKRKHQLEMLTKKNVKKRTIGKQDIPEKKTDKIEDSSLNESNIPAKRRIKQAMVEVCEPLIVRTGGGPRVKQVSRVSVSNIDLSRQKCLVKLANRVSKVDDANKEVSMPESPNESRSQHTNKLDNDDKEILRSSSGFSLAVCCNQSQAAYCESREDTDNNTASFGGNMDNNGDGEGDGNNDKYTEKASKSEQCNQESNVTSAIVTSLLDEVIDKRSINNNNVAALMKGAELDVYRESDKEDIVSEEENIDPDLDNINIGKAEIITTTLAHDGGYPIVTSRKAMPNKVMCYSCGSGGDQMIHCVSCAEPFHFFCIEFQFRPKSKEMFVCRNCTKCEACNNYGSDLKCIKCQVGYHPACVDRYPPSRDSDRSNWACFKCAMCLHCGTRAEDAMDEVLKKDCKDRIDWGNDPWQCGRCYRSRKNGRVCPECGRAYQDGLETVECNRCCKSVHRQCAGLTEDEFEIQKDRGDDLPLSAIYECSECENGNSGRRAGSSNEQKKRINLRRSCKESGLKIYCETQVNRRISDFIRQGEAKEEQLLEEHNLSSLAGSSLVRSDSGSTMLLAQLDGINDDDEEIEGDDNEEEEEENGNEECQEQCIDELMLDDSIHHIVSPPPMPSNGAMCNSSESVEDFDLDQLTSAEMDHCISVVSGTKIDMELPVLVPDLPRTKIGIFSRLLTDDFLSPKHLIMEAMARILMKLGRYSSKSPLKQAYDILISYLRHLCESMFPWIDFNYCVSNANEIVKSNSARATLVLKIVSDTVRDGLQREMDVFSSTVWDIENKLYASLVRGREDFIIFHSEQNLTSLMKSIESSEAPSDQHYCRYKLAFEMEYDVDSVYEEDIRRCSLCGSGGDDGLEGRLIYGNVDVWVHVNCALWSDEVYERDDGALVNVDVAIKRGLATVCDSCHRTGATLRCSAVSDACKHCYHFNCAFNRLRDPVFTESRTFYCSEIDHDQCRDEKQLGLPDMLILRRIYMPRLSMSVETMCLSSDNIVITIGNLRIDSLGMLQEHSDAARAYLCPIRYEARRLFWSMNELDSLVMYYMTVKDEPNRNKSSSLNSVLPVIEMARVPQRIGHQVPSLAKRRRVIDTVDSRSAKRPRVIDTSDSRQSKRSKDHCVGDIVYEMDDLGNLCPILTGADQAPVTAIPAIVTQCKPHNIEHKVNRRFPKECHIRKPNYQSSIAPISHPAKNKMDIDDEDALKIVSIDLPPSKPINPPITFTQFLTHRRPLYQPSAMPLLRPPVTTSHTQYRPHQSNHVNLSRPPNNSTGLPRNTVPHHQILHQILPHQQQQSLLPSQSFTVGHRTINVRMPVQRAPVIIHRPALSITRPATSIIRLPHIPSANHALMSPPSQPHSPFLQHTTPHQILKVTKLKPVTKPNSLQDNNISVLRTVLTDTSTTNVQRQSRTENAARTDYIISSSGTLIPRSVVRQPKHISHIDQLDGEADDASNAEDSLSSNGSDHETATVTTITSIAHVNKTQGKTKTYVKAYSDYNHIPLFSINGFICNRSPKSAWTYLVRKVARMRSSQGFTEYPLKTGDGWSKFGINHRSVVYIIEQMVGAFNCRQYEFKYHKATIDKIREQCLPSKEFDGARMLHWINDQPEHIVRDPLAFLRCKSNRPPKNYAPDQLDPLDESEPNDDYIQRLATQFRKLKSGVSARVKNVQVCVSEIHGRGLFARREFSAHDIIIEYVGETIRSIMSDVRETEYQKNGVDCYMFRLDQDMIVDATYKGNAARFINHSCQPNCYAKVVKFEGEKHIVIIAQRRIYKGEELTYDYRFPIEDDKLLCTCGTRGCRKYLN